MAEFTSLNGFMVKDTTARNIAKGRNQAVTFVDYATMIEALNEMEKDEYKAGQNIYIGFVGVPDLWVYGVEEIRHTYEYVSDEEVVEKMKTNTTVQVGFFKLAMLEGQKVDLTTYDQKLAEHTDDIAELNESLDTIGNCEFIDSIERTGVWNGTQVTKVCTKDISKYRTITFCINWNGTHKWVPVSININLIKEGYGSFRTPWDNEGIINGGFLNITNDTNYEIFLFAQHTSSSMNTPITLSLYGIK